MKPRREALHVASYEQVKLDPAQRKREKKKKPQKLDFMTRILLVFPENC